MRWFVLWLGVALLAVGLWSHYRAGKLADEWERQNQAELAKVPSREAEARTTPAGSCSLTVGPLIQPTRRYPTASFIYSFRLLCGTSPGGL